MPKLTLTVSEELLSLVEAERADSESAKSRATFVRRIVERAIAEMRRARWDESEFAHLEQLDEPDPYEFVTWPGYPHDDYTETLIARIKSF